MNMHMAIFNYLRNQEAGMNKKILIAAGLIALMAFTSVITFKSLENLDQLDLNDPFEVDLDDE